MATQMTAITLVSTTGLGYTDGARVVQFYFGLPAAMIILSATLVPFFYRARVYTAYEYLEQRFDAKTRALASLLFLVSRGLAAGVTIAAPAIVLSIVLGWSLPLTILAIGLPTTVYTMVGGVQAVTWVDVKQMVVIMVGVTAAVVALIVGLPNEGPHRILCAPNKSLRMRDYPGQSGTDAGQHPRVCWAYWAAAGRRGSSRLLVGVFPPFGTTPGTHPRTVDSAQRAAAPRPSLLRLNGYPSPGLSRVHNF